MLEAHDTSQWVGDGRAEEALWQGVGISGFSHFRRIYSIILPSGISRCLFARCPNLLLLSRLVSVIAVGGSLCN